MTKRRLCIVAALSLSLLPAAQNLQAHPPVDNSPGFSHSREITHPFLPLASLKQDILEGTEGSKTIRVERTPKPEVRKTFKIAGQTVEALAVEDREFENGRLAEVTLDFFAQADDGTVYYLGEAVDEYNKNGQVTGHSGAWMLGADTQKPGILLPGAPKIGDKFRSEDVPKITTEDDEIVSVSATVKTPSGTYKNCLKVRERLSDGAIEFKYYARGIGCIKEVPAGGDLLLKSHAVNSTSAAQQLSTNQGNPAQLGAKDAVNDPLARLALAGVGADPYAEEYWYSAINDPSLSAHERQDLIEDLNEDGISNPDHPTLNDLPLILNRISILQQIGGYPMDQVNADAFAEAYKDLINMAAALLPQPGG